LIISNWRDIFSILKINQSVSHLILENIKFVFNFIYENKYMSDISYLEFNETISGGMNKHDISEVISLVYQKIRSNSSGELKSIKQTLMEMLKASFSSIDRKKIESIYLNFKELDGLTRQLQMYRNVWAHPSGEITDSGWNFLLSGLLLRLLEVNMVNNFSSENSELIRQTSFNLIEKTIMEEPSGLLKNYISKNISEKHINTEDIEHSENLETIIEKINGLSLQISSLNNTYNDDTESIDDQEILDDLNTNVNVRNFYSIEVARQELLKIRNKIEYESEHKPDWPGPAANILQISIIEEILKMRPKNHDDFIEMPEFKWRSEKNRNIMVYDLEKWWSKIEAIIEKINN
jgi:hypothetical protein